jgi:tetratricopeptide (TPR) repeat protein
MKARAILGLLLALTLTTLAFAQSNDAKAKFNAGLTAKKANNMATAEKELLEAVKLDATYTSAWLELGTVQFNLKKLPQAEESFKKVTTLDPANQSGFYNLGMVLLTEKKYQLSEASLLKSLQLKSGDAETQKGLGQLYFQQNNWDKAIEYYKLYNTANSVDGKSHFFLAKAFKEKGDLASAEAEYMQAVKIEPKLADAHVNLGNLQMAQKKTGAAIASYKAAIAADKNMALAYYALAGAYQENQNYDAALQSYKDFVRLAEGKAALKSKVTSAKSLITQIEEYQKQSTE